MKNKIIFLSVYSIKREFDNIDYYPESDFFYLYGMAHHIYGDLPFKQEEINFEVWRADINVLQESSKKINQNVLGKVFPLIKLFSGVFYSSQMLAALKKESQNSNAIYILLGMHNFFLSLIAFKVRKYPLISIQIGGPDPFWKYKRDKKVKSLILGYFEQKFSVRYHDYCFVSNHREKEYWSMNLDSNRILNKPIISCDVDNLFYPIEKAKAKEDLNLPKDKRIILVVGRLYYSVGVQHILEIIEELKKKGYYVLWIGANAFEGDLKKRLIETGIRYEGRIMHNQLYKYYNAADLYLYTPFDEEALNFGGTGYQSIEALACGIPVISTTMASFLGKMNTKACKIPKDPKELVPMINEVFSSYPSAEECRNMVYEIYNKAQIENFQIQLYESLFEEYFKQKIIF